MVDNMIVKCFEGRITKHLTPEFFRNKHFVWNKGINDYTFKLKNPENMTSSYLEIVCAHINSDEKKVFFQIRGSLRKWWYGDMSVKDFSKKDYEDAISLLFDILAVSKRKMKYFCIARIEVGMNIFIKTPCSEILSRIVGFTKNKSKPYSRNSYEGTGIVFETKTNGNFLKLYDKVKEISKNFKKNSLIKDFKEESQAQFLKDYTGKNILRIEFTLAMRSKIKKELGFDNLEDSVSHFDTSYSYFWEQIKNIQFGDVFNKIQTLKRPIENYKEVLIHFAKIGMNISGIEFVNEIIKQIKNRNVRRKVRKLFAETSDGICSNVKDAFMKDVRNRMLFSMCHSKCLFLVEKLHLNKIPAA
jgi:hypothetical protein